MLPHFILFLLPILDADINYLKQERFPLLINGRLTNQFPSMPKGSFYAQLSNQYNSPLPWFCCVILISHCVYHGNPKAVHLDDLIIISSKLVVEQGIFHQERLCDFINLGIAKLYLFSFSDYNLQLRKWARLEWNSHFNEEGYIWSFFLTYLLYSFILFQGIRELSSFRNFPSEWKGGVFHDFCFWHWKYWKWPPGGQGIKNSLGSWGNNSNNCP